jgi:hypothetical protein
MGAALETSLSLTSEMQATPHRLGNRAGNSVGPCLSALPVYNDLRESTAIAFFTGVTDGRAGPALKIQVRVETCLRASPQNTG